MSTKIHIAVDALGNVLRLLYTAGQVHESTKAEALIAGLPAQNLLGDKAWYYVSTVGRDEQVIREYIRNQEKEDMRLEQMNLWR